MVFCGIVQYVNMFGTGIGSAPTFSLHSTGLQSLRFLFICMLRAKP